MMLFHEFLKHNTIDQVKQFHSATKIRAYGKVANHKPVKGILLYLAEIAELL